MPAAELRGIGALQSACLAHDNRSAQEYGEFAVDGVVEIVSPLGNVPRRDGATAVHGHASLAGRDGAGRDDGSERGVGRGT